MNNQFTKTLEALEVAENEMIELHNILDGLEIRNRASWHETQTVANCRIKLKTMQESIRAMFGKREEELLRGLRAEQCLHPTAFGVDWARLGAKDITVKTIITRENGGG